MHIKQINVNGFKAFAEKEDLTFNKGICALVGPNGSGKSNVVDAIKWVIGEQKVSELRGERLEDLIFSGSQKFKPQNFAEVEIHFDNSEKKFSISYDDLSVMRRMYRSGESEFFINRQSCRLKDIQDIFLNSGLGKSSYAIIPQGKIDQILSDKVEEKRKLFEEAAAITKFRERKKEYEAKIFKANENLTRVDDLLKQSLRRRSQLSKQSGDTAKYFELNDHIKKVKIDLLLHDLSLNVEEVEVFGKQIAENEKKSKGLNDQLQELKKHIQLLNSSLSSDDRDLNELEKERIKNEQRKSSLEKEKSWYEEGIRDVEQRLKTMEENLLRLQQEIDQNQKRLQQNLTQAKNDKEQVKSSAEKIKNLQKQLEKVTSSLQNLEEENQLLTDLLGKKERDRVQVNETEQKILLQLIQEIDTLKKDLEKKNIITSRDDFSKKINALVEDILSLDTDHLSDPEVIARVIEIKKRTLLNKDFYKSFFEEERSFYNFFFSAEGTYSIREKLAQELESVMEEITATRQHLNRNLDAIRKNQALREKLTRQIEQEKFNLSGYEQSLIALENDSQEKKNALQSIKDMEKKSNAEKEFSNKKKKELTSKIVVNNRQLIEIETANQEIVKRIDGFFQQQKDKKKKFEQSLKQETAIQQDLERIQKKNYEYTAKVQVLEREREALYEKGSYQCAVDLRQHPHKKLAQIEKSRQELQLLERELQTLGTVNPLAKEEFDEIDLRIQEVEKQKKDILESIADLEQVNQETLHEGKKIFLETFEEVNRNFSMLIKELFPGGDGLIHLDSEGRENNPLDADISIVVQPKGKKFQKLNLFSGGERSLIVLAFVFSFFLRRPAPFCLLDEVDAALDSSNIERFMRLLKKMQKYTQLILISHNQKTMQIVDYMYGFSMKDGVTRVFSLKV